ncbi:beta-glucosidase [Azospirillum fermentarium]|uniref:GH1 family beta-glucosidase n=1 Tax=Azospirillum fermentarium TaxID=1233114 RepID=UPI0029CAC3F1|nr:GH1 family beta-glucosidase [Azospirillum fermentarium]MCW2247112.1 beta-glucosidase [Azospirillum fermentarium]
MMHRRSLLKASLATLGAALGAGPLAGGRTAAPALAQAGGQALAFPPGFVWGVSTSAYQVEGAVTADGRGPSVWDTFSHTPGRIVTGENGDVACDHYHRYLEDVGLMAGMGLNAYRFSIAWPRVMPTGTGAVNAKGLDFYDRLTDALLARGIEPWACLYHWDLPQALQDRGGWTNRDSAGWFTDYALAVAGRLGDRVKRWAMLNEPSVVAIFGHGTGDHAPGLRGTANYFAAIHNQNRAQGQALAALRQTGRTDWSLGTVLTVQPIKAAGGLEANRPAAVLWDAVWNRSCTDPLFLGRYPEPLEADFAPLTKAGDMETIRQPVDFLGLNYYSRLYQRLTTDGLFGTGFDGPPEGTRRTGMGWPVEPDGLLEQLLELRDRYGNPPVYVTENGADYYDWVGPEGKVEDGERIAFLRAHLAAAHQAIAQGANLKGFFAWTLLDNFEWAEGYARHFGLVAVDRETLARRPKASYYWYADTVRRNAVAV